MKRFTSTVLFCLLVFSPAIISAGNNQPGQAETTETQDSFSATDTLPPFNAYGNDMNPTQGSSAVLLKNLDNHTNASMDLFGGLEGQVSGMDISPAGAEPGAYVRMLIRGIGSVNAGNDPLIVIDGVVFDNASYDAAGYRFSGLAEMEWDDFETVEILKSAVATAQYGARGANGVIVITTKSGSAKERNKLSLTYRQGISASPKQMDMLSADQYIQVVNRAYQNSFPDATDPIPLSLHTYDGFYNVPHVDGDGISREPNLANTNWYDNMHVQGVNHYVRGSFSGGDERTQYFLSGTYRYDEGFLYASVHDRANFRLNITNKATDRLTLGLNSYLASHRRDVSAKQWFETAQTSALPVYPVRSPLNPGLFWFNEDAPVNIEALNERSWNKTGGLRTFNTAFAEFSILEGLSVKSQWSWDFQHYRNEDYKHPHVAPSDNGLLIIGRTQRSNWSGNNFLMYNNTIGQHDMKARAGFSMESFSWNGNHIYNPGMTLLFIHSNGESNQRRLAWTNVENFRFYSFYGNVAYEFDQKYGINLSLRSDASSRFGNENRTHIFPAASLNWTISNESFAQNIDLINYLQLHAGYGITGNAQMANFLHLSTLGMPNENGTGFQGYYQYGDYPAVAPVTMGNPYLGPEISAQFDAGLGFAILNNRLAGKVSYFHHNNTQLLNAVPLSPLYGFESDFRWVNDGELTSSGIELFLSPQILQTANGISWHLDLHLTSLNTTLTKAPEGLEYLEGYFNRSYEGELLGGYYLAEWAGVDPETGHELIVHPETGDIIDAEILSDEEFTAMATYFADKTPFANLYGGLTNRLAIGNFNLSFTFSFKQGHHLLDLGEQSRSYINAGSTATSSLTEGWTSENPTQVPLLYNSAMSQRVTSRFLHDASYIRLQQVMASYTLPSSIAGLTINQKITFFFAANNLITFSDFPGYDPNGLYSAYNSMSNLDAGLLMFDPPNPRTFMFGLSVEL